MRQEGCFLGFIKVAQHLKGNSSGGSARAHHPFSLLLAFAPNNGPHGALEFMFIYSPILRGPSSPNILFLKVDLFCKVVKIAEHFRVCVGCDKRGVF